MRARPAMANQSQAPATLVVIGAHRDELAFGERVIEGLDPSEFAVLRIPRGLFGQRPRPGEVEGYRDRHHALYAQILDCVAPGQRLMIDLHCGLDQRGLCADVLCADLAFLDCLAAGREGREAAAAYQLRCVRLVADTASPDLRPRDGSDWLVAKPEIPQAVWNSPHLLYVGVEVYLRREGGGTSAEWELARAVLRDIVSCGLDRR